MALQLRQIADVANMVTYSILVRVGRLELLTGHLVAHRNAFDQRGAVIASATEVVDLAWPRILDELFKRSHDIIAVDLVTNLLSLVAKDRVMPARYDLPDQIREETVEFNARMRRPGQASAAKYTDGHVEIPPVLLSHYIARGLRRSKKRM